MSRVLLLCSRRAASRVPGCRNPAITSCQFSAVPPTEPGLLEKMKLLPLDNASVEAPCFQLCSGGAQRFEPSCNSHPKGSPALSVTHPHHEPHLLRNPKSGLCCSKSLCSLTRPRLPHETALF